MSLLGWIMRAVAWLVWPTAVGSIVLLILWLTTDMTALPLILVGGSLLLCVLALFGYTRLLKRRDFYNREIAHGLDRAFEEVGSGEPVELGRLRIVVLSDQHKGTRDGADDFWRSERAYCAALAYYYEMGHTLVVLGDAEELWENWPSDVVRDYRDVLGLERRFAREDRYVRVWGNHDDDWRSARAVERRLGDRLGRRVEVVESLKLEVTQRGNPLGVLFFAHGHQGTADSEILTPLSRPGVRIFGHLQRLFKKPWNTPASDWELRERHDTAMFAWAKGRRRDAVVLVAGHTHRPVFGKNEIPVPSTDDIRSLAGRRDRARGRKSRALLAAELEYKNAERRWSVNPPQRIDPPCYFNTGCCAFADGDVTAIEIADRGIQLVRFPDNDGRPRPQRLAGPLPLADVLNAVRT